MALEKTWTTTPPPAGQTVDYAGSLEADASGYLTQPVNLYYKDASGNFQPLKTDASGNVQVVVAEALPALSPGTNTIGAVTEATLDASGGAPAAAAPAKALQVGGSDGTDLRALLVDTLGRLQAVIASALPAGTNNIGHVNVDALPALAAGTNTIGNVTETNLDNAAFSWGTLGSGFALAVGGWDASSKGRTLVTDTAGILATGAGLHTTQVIMQNNAAATGQGTELSTVDTAGTTSHGVAFPTAVIEISGTFVATVTFQGVGPHGGTYTVYARNRSTGLLATTATAPGIYEVDARGLTGVYANITAYTSGSVSASGMAVAVPPATNQVELTGRSATELYHATTGTIGAGALVNLSGTIDVSAYAAAWGFMGLSAVATANVTMYLMPIDNEGYYQAGYQLAQVVSGASTSSSPSPANVANTKGAVYVYNAQTASATISSITLTGRPN